MYQALYRKYRPKSFDEVYGQETAKKILTNALKLNKIEHAYLFFGPRGTGKTSIAKMFARIINCTDRKNEKQCDKCVACQNSNNNDCVDIIEIDAASNNGVDEIRELKSKISLVPTILKYKVYIIDEVHMLTANAFNALLKTLEEPPEHAIFILATTEYYKVPATIVSRCQTIEFKNIDSDSMKNRISEIANLEKISIDDDAVSEIVNNSNGGLRDAIGLFDKMQAYCDKNITVDEVKKVIGSISTTEVKKISEDLINKNVDNLIEKINEYSILGYDLVKIFDDIINEVNNSMLKDRVYNNVELLNNLLDYEEKLRKSNNKKIVFELAILDICNQTNVCKNISREIISEQVEEKIELEKENKIKVEEKIKVDNTDIYVNNAFSSASKNLLLEIKENWKTLNNYAFDSEYGAISCLLIESIPVVCGESNLIISTKYDAEANKLNNEHSVVERFLKEKFSVTYIVTAICEEEWNKYKNEFIKNKENGIQYTYIELNQTKEKEKKKNVKKNDIKDKATELFGSIVS